MEGRLVIAKRGMTEPDLEGYTEKVWMNARIQAKWVSVSLMGGGVRMDRITARSSIGEFFHGCGEIREIMELESAEGVITGGDFESRGYFRDGGTPLVYHRSQISRSFLPRCQEFQEVTKVVETTSIGDSVRHSCGQVREDGFQ